MANPFSGAAVTGQDKTCKHEYIGQIGSNLERLVGTGGCLLEARLHEQNAAKRAMGIRILGINRQRPLNVGFRFFQCGLADITRSTVTGIAEMPDGKQAVERGRPGIEYERPLPTTPDLDDYSWRMR